MEKKYVFIFRAFGENKTSFVKIDSTDDIWLTLKIYKDDNPYFEIVYIEQRSDAEDLVSKFKEWYPPTIEIGWYEEVMLQKMLEVVI